MEATFLPAEFTHVTSPSKPVVGNITDADTGKPIAGVLVSAWRDIGIYGVPSENKNIYATTDAQGHYRLEGIEPSRPKELVVTPPDGSPYLADGDTVTVKLDDPELTKNFQLRQGVLVRGRAVDDRTGEGIPGTIRYHAYPDEPNLKPMYPGLFRMGIQPEAAGADGRFVLAWRRDAE